MQQFGSFSLLFPTKRNKTECNQRNVTEHLSLLHEYSPRPMSNPLSGGACNRTMGTVEESQREKKYHSRRNETVGQSQQSKNRGIWRNQTLGESLQSENRNCQRRWSENRNRTI
uniref:Uncharacterized protein n=1 Tax=Romanomermis culicivorax TaxID=13658 RepID=A0A915KK91_ROMCU